MTDKDDLSKTNESKIEVVSNHYDADILFYSGEIDYDGFGKLVGAVQPSRPNVLLILITTGGSANAAYQIARLIQKVWSNGKFYLYLPSYCKSAGTLIALGANVILVDMNSELGPLDVQLLKQDEIGARRSGLLSRSTFDALEIASFSLFEHLMLQMKKKSYDLISFKLASELSSRMVGDLMAPIYSQISPDVIGSDWRDLQVALHYGLRLVTISENASVSTVRHLIHGYPSHDFVIDDDEIRSLFHRVDVPHPNLFEVLQSLVELVGDSAYNEDPEGIVISLPPAKSQFNDENPGDQDGKEDGEEEAPSTSNGAGQPGSLAENEEETGASDNES